MVATASSPCRRLITLMRPSQPTRQRCPRRNQRWRSYARRAGDFGPRRGKITRRTPRSVGGLFVGRRAEAAIAGREIRRAAEDRLMSIQGRRPQRDVRRSPRVHLVGRDDLMFRFLNGHELAELVRLRDLALPNRRRYAVRRRSGLCPGRACRRPADAPASARRRAATSGRSCCSCSLGALQNRAVPAGGRASPLAQPTDHRVGVAQHRARRGHQLPITLAPWRPGSSASGLR